MFYSSQILARKGPLGIVWIAAHVDSQLKRNQVRGSGSARLAWPLPVDLLDGRQS
jgi:hypothetical protein